MDILLTNDDGIESDSLHPLIARLSKKHHVVALVPDRERSASSHSITLSRPLRLRTIRKNVHTLDGTPTDCSNVALLGGLGKRKFDLVISGINKGPNLCEDVFYSGTVAAAREGALMGIPALAVSLDTVSPAPDYSTAIDFLSRFVDGTKFPEGTLININFPECPAGKIKGARWTRLGKRKYKDVLIKRKDPWGNPYFWLHGQGITYSKEDGEDSVEVKRGFISLTPLSLDLTDAPFLSEWRHESRLFKGLFE
jgi:5'-nucleotidase